jgi:hypothetical protein
MIFAKQFAALTRKPQKGDRIWTECRLSAGIEQGTVRAECVELAFVEDKRKESLKGLVFFVDGAFNTSSQEFLRLKSLVEASPGNVPLVLDVPVPAENGTIRCKMPPVNASDEFISQIETEWPGLLFVHRCYSSAEMMNY